MRDVEGGKRRNMLGLHYIHTGFYNADIADALWLTSGTRFRINVFVVLVRP